eukprot:CAMPEP_0201562216 /NCGR_PEP_ID=MMETSP0173_2-20130828/79207_1 /ASSEMBLY_ACC=CAM_ASM_000268 /TAXON_ID=218659 /ORGANISM="Vexillifera sp., Strain DIVA3 564/2" /LENGTH=83 /DNA_ID=CAMNT_0047976763 /DNA_START=346 /DNA_END=597 /DNA_ORIENTATION=-
MIFERLLKEMIFERLLKEMIFERLLLKEMVNLFVNNQSLLMIVEMLVVLHQEISMEYNKDPKINDIHQTNLEIHLSQHVLEME